MSKLIQPVCNPQRRLVVDSIVEKGGIHGIARDGVDWTGPGGLLARILGDSTFLPCLTLVVVHLHDQPRRSIIPSFHPRFLNVAKR